MGTKVLTEFWHVPNNHTLGVYEGHGGYASLGVLFAKQPGEIIDLVKASGLRGRGGAGFPCGLK